MSLSLLGLFNAVSPKDKGSRCIVADIGYGAAPSQRLDIYAPIGADRRLPVLQFIHGGGWTGGNKNEYEFVGRALAALGYVTVLAGYRMVPEVEYPVFVRDGVSAMQWIVDNIADFGGDARRIGLIGHSAGAYNAVMMVLDPRHLASRGLRERVRAVVGLSGPYDFHPFDGPISLRVFGAARHGQLTQPIHHAAAGAPPMLLATGDRDRLVHPRNTIAMAARLRALEVPVVERHYRGLDHPAPMLALGRVWRARAPVLDDIRDFLDGYLRGADEDQRG